MANASPHRLAKATDDGLKLNGEQLAHERQRIGQRAGDDSDNVMPTAGRILMHLKNRTDKNIDDQFQRRSLIGREGERLIESCKTGGVDGANSPADDLGVERFFIPEMIVNGREIDFGGLRNVAKRRPVESVVGE